MVQPDDFFQNEQTEYREIPDICPGYVIFKRRNHRRHDREMFAIFRSVTTIPESLKDQDKYLHIHNTILIFYFQTVII